MSIGLEMRLHKDIHIHKGISTMVGLRWSHALLALPFIAFSSSHWFITTIWDNSYPSSDKHCSLTLTLLFLMPLPIHFY